MTLRIGLGLICLAGLLLTGCATAPDEQTIVEVDCEEFALQSHSPAEIFRAVSVSRGTSIELRVCSNPSTGFEWEEADISESSILTEVSHEFVPPSSAKDGSPGQEHWTFEAIEAGDCTVSFAYSRPWERGEKGIWKLTLDVTVD